MTISRLNDLNPFSKSKSGRPEYASSSQDHIVASTRSSRTQEWTKFAIHHLRRHTGVGIVCAVAYFDPGNWGVDLQAGSQYGYKLLFVVLLAGLLAIFFQILASRLGCVTGLDLATHCRLLLHDRPKHKMFYRWGMLYPLYVIAEIAIIATDLAELIGSAIALVMIFPQCPMWVGVVVTAFDVLLIMGLANPLGGRPVRAFEFIIAILVLITLISMIIVITKVNLHWGDVFFGYVPSNDIVSKPGSLYVSIGIIGATIMPHSVFVGSALATQDREISAAEFKERSTMATEEVKGTRWQRFKNLFKLIPGASKLGNVTSHRDWQTRPLAFVKAHINHGAWDVALSLLIFAVAINSMILIVAGGVFYYGNGTIPQGRARDEPAGLFDAHDVIGEVAGKAFGFLFAFALLAAGQSSSIIATVAGQAVSEGFLNWRVTPFLRRLITRCISIIPALVVAIAVGRRGVDMLLVLSQVILSVVLPFVIAPLLYLTSRKDVMTVTVSPIDKNVLSQQSSRTFSPDPDAGIAQTTTDSKTLNQELAEPEAFVRTASSSTEDDLEASPPKTVRYDNHWTAIAFGVAIWLVISCANVYAIVMLGIEGP